MVLVFHGEKSELNLSEFAMLKNLKSLTLQKHKIDDNFANILNGFEDLKTIQFSVCEIKNRNVINAPNLDRTIIEHCEFSSLAQFMPTRIFHVSDCRSKLDLRTLQQSDNIESLYLQNCKKIEGFEHVQDFKNLRELNIDGSQVDNEKVLEEIKNKMPVSHREENLPIR